MDKEDHLPLKYMCREKGREGGERDRERERENYYLEFSERPTAQIHLRTNHTLKLSIQVWYIRHQTRSKSLAHNFWYNTVNSEQNQVKLDGQ